MAQDLRRHIPTVIRRLVFFAGLVFVLFPLLWLLKSSFVTNEETLIAPIQYLPRSFTLNNYLQPLLGISVTIRGEVTESPDGISPLVGYIKNGAIVAFFVVVINGFLATLTGYGFSRFRFFGRKSLLVLLLNTQMFPYIAILVPLYVMYRTLGLLNTYTGLIIGEVGLVLPFSIWMIKSFCDTLDEDLEESALIEGASRIRILWTIVFPVIVPGIASVAMFSFLASWNHLLYVMVLNTRETLITVPLGLIRDYGGGYNYYYSTMSAGLLIVSLPVAVVFVWLQRYFAAGLTAGALKG